MYDIIVAGAGTAGMTAGIYAARAGKSVLIIEETVYGGQIIKAEKIENYPGIPDIPGADFAMKLYEHATAQHVEFSFAPVSAAAMDNGIITIHAGEKDYQCKAFIIATGSKNKPLGIKGEKEFIGKGVSYCATCDGNFFKNKTVCVVGGGNTALGDALYLCDLCKTVYVINHGTAFNAEEDQYEDARKRGNIKFITDTSVTEILGESKVNAIALENEKSGELTQLKTDGVFVAIGHTPGNQLFSNFVDLDEKGYIIAGEDTKTKTPGIFAAGDCRKKNLRQLVTAAADGAAAATAAAQYIKQLDRS